MADRAPLSAQLGTDLAEGPALGVQVGCTLNVHGDTVTTLSLIRLTPSALVQVQIRPFWHDCLTGRPLSSGYRTVYQSATLPPLFHSGGNAHCVWLVVCVIVGGTDGLGKWSALNESLPGRIFISYRRQETAWPAGRLYDVLVEHFPAEQVFKDVDSIEPGEDFVERITAAVSSCDVLLALIGPQWLTITDENGQRRLDNPGDYVRVEIETALTRKIRVIPILVDAAQMPRANELPATLAPLVRRNAVEINPLTFDTKRLIAAVQQTLAEEQARREAEEQAQRSRPRSRRGNRPRNGPGNRPRNGRGSRPRTRTGGRPGARRMRWCGPGCCSLARRGRSDRVCAVGRSGGGYAEPCSGVGHVARSHRDCAASGRVGVAAASSRGGRDINAGGG